MFNETREALERQTATAEILKVIASSPNDVQPVFDVIVERAVRLCGARMGRVYRYDDGMIHLVAGHGLSAPGLSTVQQVFPRPAADDTTAGLAIQSRQPYFVTDIENDEAVPALSRQMIEALGTRSQVTVPMLRTGEPIGAITVGWADPGAYGDQQVALLQTFADQAVIAIENVRLFNETREALERQTATADILKVIASSPNDVQPVFEAIAASAKRLLGGFSATVVRFVGDTLHLVAFTPTNATADQALQASFPMPLAGFSGFELVRGGQTVQFTDTELEDVPRVNRELARLRGYRSMVFTPLMSNGTPIGMISVTRKEPGSFSAHYVQLLQTFADQAVIAIENVRLFDEVQAKTHDLTEALTYQTGSSNILKVIASSPTDVEPVLKAIVENACELCDAYDAAVVLKDGDDLRFSAHHGPIPIGLETWPINRSWTAGRAFVDKRPVHVPDLFDSADFPDGRELARRMGHRSILSVPLLRENESIGAIILRRTEVQPFSDKQITLLQTFADQAVIAIGNVRLFDEVQARTHDLTEALQQQTATADVLKVISRSVFDLQTVLDTLVESAYKLCAANLGLLYLRGDEAFECKAIAGVGVAEASRLFKGRPIRAGRGTAAERVILTGEVQSITDFFADPEMDPKIRETIRNANGSDSGIGQIRSTLAVPMTRDNAVIGVMVIGSSQTGPFPPRQIELLQTFADQAVIAIENVRLFDEVQARTRDLTEALTYQTGSSNILKVIASSPTDVGPVLKAIVENACELCEADDAVVNLRDGNELRYGAQHGTIPIGFERRAINRNWVTGRSVVDKVPIHLHDVLSAEGAEFPEAQEMSRRTGNRTILSVPLLRTNESIGAIILRRTEVNPFSENQIALLQTFADQAVIAIGNVQLFDEVQARTRELSQSLDELRTAQDRLVQTEKLASLGQLTAGIAHEIKNPLNFVNNFSALSAELTDELNDVLKSATLAGNIREEVDELTGLLKDNLQKVVQHGRRADSIVKNMLLHSREGSGEHRPADINALLEESLNLAYHGARAEKPQFNVTLQRDFDEAAGTIEVFPQEITRVFLNLISNGFYAVTRRKMEIGHSGFDPIVSATTRNLGHAVEIRIRDNGTGIPAEVKEKMFNPFFTTKPAGEGTGLGLSMSHDIIVKQHGGRIEVETEPGRFTEFTIVLPRASTQSDKNRGPT